MVIGSHNSWSYLRPKKWWMRLIAFTARCQRVDIKKQYELGVRCFDLRFRFKRHMDMEIAHGPVVYDLTGFFAGQDLYFLDQKGDCYVRVIHEVRTEEQYTKTAVELFQAECEGIERRFKNIQFWCGRNLYNWERDYTFKGDEPTCQETYGSVVPGKKWLYGWWPWLYARTHNRKIRERGTDKDILLIDYVDI